MGDSNRTPESVSFPRSVSTQDLFLQLLNKSPFQKGDLELLTDKVTPKNLLHRDKERGQIVDAVASVLRHSQPSHLFVYGKPGTGKTAVAKHVLDEMSRLQGLTKRTLGLYVNCLNNVSHHALIRQLIVLLEKGDDIPSNAAASDLHSRLLKACKKENANIVLILDEVSRLVKKTGYDALYSLSNMNSEMGDSQTTITLIAISNNLHFGEKLDPAVQSRLSAQKLYFAPYTADELKAILNDRVRDVFVEGGLEVGLVELCSIYAAQSHGDARKALSLLRMAAVIAGREGAQKVAADHVIRARAALEIDIISDGVRKLPIHAKLVLYAISQATLRHTAGEILNTGRVIESYTKYCGSFGVRPLGARSVSFIVDDLADQGLLRTEIRSLGRARGRTTLVYLDTSPEDTLAVIREDSFFESRNEGRKSTNTTLDGFAR